MKGILIEILMLMLFTQGYSLKDYLKVPLYGNFSTGYYDVYMTLGGQQVRLTADTGSNDMVI